MISKAPDKSPKYVKLFADIQRLGDVHLVRPSFGNHFVRVVQFAVGCVPCPRVVVGLGTFQRRGVQPLDYLHVPTRLQQFEHQRDRRAHDAAANAKDVHLFVVTSTPCEEGPPLPGGRGTAGAPWRWGKKCRKRSFTTASRGGGSRSRGYSVGRRGRS